MATEAEAAEIFKTYAGLSDGEAKVLVKAIVEAAQQEALENVTGTGAQPSSMADARALRLRRICEAAGRSLSQREVELIFRMTATSATSLTRRMQASYPQSVDQFMREVVRKNALAEETGKPGAFRYDVHFDVPEAYDYAIQILQREGLTRDVRKRPGDQVLSVPRQMTDRAGRDVDPLTVLNVNKRAQP